MKATNLLDDYSKLERILRPDVSAAIVLASLQKYGKGTHTLGVTVDEHTTQLASLATMATNNINRWKSVKYELKKLKEKKPTWNK